MRNSVMTAWLLAAALAAAPVAAQSLPAPENVVQLAATGSVEVPQDWLAISLTTTREGLDPQAVQSQLKQALDAALAEARRSAAPGQLELRTGNFSIYPRQTRDGKISGWQGSAELVLEGRDFARISATAGRVQTMTMGRASFSLSREQRGRVEGEAQALAIERFKAKAADIARGFGFSGYGLREVSVQSNEPPPMVPMRAMAMEAKAAADTAVPVEAGKTTVLVTVAGSVQLK